VVFDVDGLEAEPIREDVEYGGVRIRTQATISGARIPIQVDVGFGDAITPGPIEIDYPTLLDAPAPHLRAYPIATVVAEKFHALATRGIANSRLKDYYDLWLIAETFELERGPLAAAPEQLAAVVAGLERFLLPLIEEADGDWLWGGLAERRVYEVFVLAGSSEWRVRRCLASLGRRYAHDVRAP
jgi:hypothetical protein